MKIPGQIKMFEWKYHRNFEPSSSPKFHIIIPSVTYSKNEMVICVTFPYIPNTWNISVNFNVLQEVDGNFEFIHSIRFSPN